MKKTWKKWIMAAAAMLGGGTIANTANAEEISQPLAGHAVDAGSNFTASPVQNKYFIGNPTENSYSNFNLQSLPDSVKISAPASKTSFSGNDAPLAKPKPLKMSAATPAAKTSPAFSLPLLDEAIKSPENAERILSVVSNNDMKPAPLKIAAASPEPAGLKLSGNYTADTVFDSYRISDRTKIEQAELKLPSPAATQNISSLPLRTSFESLSGSRLNFAATPPDTLSQYAPMSQKPEKNKWNERLKYTAPPVMGKSISESAQKIQTAPSKCSINFTKGMDAHYKKGQSDQRGDHKAAEITLRCNNTIADLHLGISTPQYIKRSDSRDTSILAVSYGRIIPLSEKTELEVTGRVGIVNGLAKTTMGALVNAMHKMQGMGASRVSQDTGTRPLAGITFRADHTENVAKLSKHKLAATFTQYSILGTDKIEAGAAATVSLISGGAKPLKPNIQGLPNQINSGSGVYLTGMVSGIAYDLATHSQGTKHARFTTGVGVQKDFGKVVLGFDATLSRSPEINGGYKPISQIGLHLGVKF